MIPLATTTVTVAHAAEPEPGEGRTFTTYARHVRACFSGPSGIETRAAGGGRELVAASLLADPIPGLTHTDRVTDDTTGAVWEVDWVLGRIGLGLDHVKAGVHKVSGYPS